MKQAENGVRRLQPLTTDGDHAPTRRPGTFVRWCLVAVLAVPVAGLIATSAAPPVSATNHNTGDETRTPVTLPVTAATDQDDLMTWGFGLLLAGAAMVVNTRRRRTAARVEFEMD